MTYQKTLLVCCLKLVYVTFKSLDKVLQDFKTFAFGLFFSIAYLIIYLEVNHALGSLIKIN